MNPLIELMENVEATGVFSVGGILPPVHPGLVVKGIGEIALPIIEPQAKELIQQSKQAPFGRGEETVYDKEVRHTWQISAEDVEFANPQWDITMRETVNQIGQDLGLHDCEIEFELYKLLVYEEGSFFTPHRDTEKTDNMFATMVVCLPSKHEGGELIISHRGQSQRYSFADSGRFQPSFAAFYADCYHEVKPIKSGYRICLTYNLSIANRKRQPKLAAQDTLTADIGDFIDKWLAESEADPILTYLLEHSYSEKNLNIANLKQKDFAKASLLITAAENRGYQAFLCLATYYRTSYGNTVYYGRHYAYNDDDLGEEDFEEEDIDQEEVYIHAFITAQNNRLEIDKLALEEAQIFSKIPLQEGPGRGYFISEATGNEGATKDLWYHRGAVAIWSKEREFELALKMDADDQIRFLENTLQNRGALEGAQRPKVINLAFHILKNQPRYIRNKLVKTLIRIGDIPLLQEYLHQEMNQYRYSYVESQVITRIVKRLGWHPFAEVMNTYMTPDREPISWLYQLLFDVGPLSDDGRSIMTEWVNRLWEPALNMRLSKDHISNLICLIALLKSDVMIAEKIIQFLAGTTGRDFLTMTYGPAVVSSKKVLTGRDYKRPLLDKFAEDIRQRVQTEFPTPPTPPSNWARDGRLGCDCEFCTAVNHFLPDPEKREFYISKTLKRNLLHVESELEKVGIDAEMEITRQRTKFTGTCRKNQNRYDRERQLFDQAHKIVSDLTRS